MKTYEGARHPDVTPSPFKSFDDDTVVVTVTDGRAGPSRLRTYKLPPRLDLRNHSPTGFEWGYAGSGPAQLALALCADLLKDDDLALQVYQRVKEKLICPIKVDRWMLDEGTLLGTVITARAEQIAHMLAARRPTPDAVPGVHVVTIIEEDGETTRCIFAPGTAEEFLTWVLYISNRHAQRRIRGATLAVEGHVPPRSAAELDRALVHTEYFAAELERAGDHLEGGDASDVREQVAELRKDQPR